VSEMPLLIADLYEAAGALRAAGESIAATQSQSQARWQVMSVVSEPAATVPTAARRLGVSRQNVQKIANDLVRDGLAEWQPNPDHRTSPLLVLTPTGQATLAELTKQAQDFNLLVSSGLSAREIASTRKVLRLVTARIAELELTDELPAKS
jgi:DNA-binding MarR family transcriptional regulator